jgi:cytochrome P450
MSRDEEKYSDADKFRPERHFTPDGSLSSDSILNDPIFGFGRRICETSPTKDEEHLY